MAIDKKEKYREMGKRTATSSFGGRIAMYIFITFWITIFTIIIATTTNYEHLFTNKDSVIMFIIYIVSLFIPGLALVLFLEKGVRMERRKLGLSIYDDISDEIEHMNLKNKLSKEQRAYSELGIGKDTDKTDIRYWKGLLDDGIISQEEFDLKKSELL